MFKQFEDKRIISNLDGSDVTNLRTVLQNEAYRVIIYENKYLYACRACGRYKEVFKTRLLGEFRICMDCNEVDVPKEPEPVITIIPKTFFPNTVDFNNFMDDVLFYESDVVPTLKDYTLTLTDQKTKKSISFDTNALLQIICDKFNHPAIHESYRTIIPIDLELKMQNLYIDVQDMLEHAILKYNRILAFEDGRIKYLVQNYARMHEIPLNLKLEFQTWEKGLVSGYISREIEKGIHEKDKELSRIRQDHVKALDAERHKNAGQLENYSREVLKLRTTVENLNSILNNARDELNSIKIEKDEVYEKIKHLEIDMNAKVVEVSKMKVEINNLKREVEKYKSDDNAEWMLDVTSTEDEPIYTNQVTGEIVQYPRDFKEKYKPLTIDMDNNILIYKEKNGDKEFKVPQTLSRVVSISSPTNPENTTISAKTKNKIAGNDMEVLNALSRDKEEAKTIEELHIITKIADTHIGTKHLKKLMELNMVAKFKGDDNVLRFYRI